MKILTVLLLFTVSLFPTIVSIGAENPTAYPDSGTLAALQEPEEIATDDVKPVEPVKIDISKSINYSEVKKNVTKEELPKYHAMLLNPSFAKDATRIAKIIGYSGGNAQSAEVILEYIQRDDSETLDSGFFPGMAKLGAIEALGCLEHENASTLLRNLLRPEFIKEVTSAWLKGRILENFENDENRYIALVQKYAAVGLIVSQKVENIALLEELYNETKSTLLKNPLYQPSNDGNSKLLTPAERYQHDLFGSMAFAMALRYYIDDNSLQDYIEKVNFGGLSEAITPYYRTYSIPLQNFYD